jgi:hypothetical protein
MKPLHLWGTVILSVMATGAVISAVNELMAGDSPVFRLNGAVGTLLLAPALLAIVARFWHRVRPISWAEKTDAILTFSEPWPNYASTTVIGACLVAFGALGFLGYQGKTIEIAFNAVLLLLGFGLLVHKLRKGRASLVLSPIGLIFRQATPIAWDRIVSAEMGRFPWKTEIVLELRQASGARERSRLRLLPTLLGADPVDLLRAIQVRQTAYTF